MQTSDIIIHIDGPLDANRRRAIEDGMRAVDGVIAPRFSRDRLLAVVYDPGRASAAALLDAVRGHGHRAQLVGL